MSLKNYPHTIDVRSALTEEIESCVDAVEALRKEYSALVSAMPKYVDARGAFRGISRHVEKLTSAIESRRGRILEAKALLNEIESASISEAAANDNNWGIDLRFFQKALKS